MKDIKYVQLEPTAFLSDIDFQMMDAEARGVYISIILYLYANGGKIELPPNSVSTLLEGNTAVLANISNCLKMGSDWNSLWSKIAHKFQINGNILTHKRVTSELEAAKRLKDAKSKAGKKGMEKRYGSNRDITKVSKDKVSKDNNSIINNTILDIANYWNNLSQLPSIRTLTKDRKRKLSVRLNEEEFSDNWKLIIDTITQTPFLLGDNDRGWIATFDWVITNSTNYIKILEGKYKNERKGLSGTKRENQNQTTGNQEQKRARISEQNFEELEMHNTTE